MDGVKKGHEGYAPVNIRTALFRFGGRFQIAACQRWSFRRIHLLFRVLQHNLFSGHRTNTTWGDWDEQMKYIRPDSWVVTYVCWDCLSHQEVVKAFGTLPAEKEAQYGDDRLARCQ